MQNTTVATSMSMKTSVPLMVPASPRTTTNVSTIRGLGITQIAIGFLTLALGIGVTSGFHKNYWLTVTGGGIWGGLWILVTGIIGVSSASDPASSMLNGTHMIFCVMSTVTAIFDGIMLAVGLGFYNNCRFYNNHSSSMYGSYSYQYYDYWLCGSHRSAEIGVYASFVTLMAVEFFVALVAAIYCCKATSGCCGGPASSGVIVQQQQPHYLVTSSTGQTLMTTSGYPTSTGVMSPVSYGYPQQSIMMQQAGTHQQMGTTNVAYSSQYPQKQQKYPLEEFQENNPPPAYQQ